MQQLNIGIYVRSAATDENISYAIQDQVTLLKNFFADHYGKKFPGFLFVRVYEDMGQSGMDMKRSGLTAMLADAEAKKINVVLTKDLSRLSRSLSDTLSMVERLKTIQCRVVTMAENESTLFSVADSSEGV